MFSNTPWLLSAEDGGNSGLQQHSKSSDWLGDVFDRLCAQVVVTQRELVADLFMHFPGDTDTSRAGEALQPCRDVDPITINLIAITSPRLTPMRNSIRRSGGSFAFSA